MEKFCTKIVNWNYFVEIAASLYVFVNMVVVPKGKGKVTKGKKNIR